MQAITAASPESLIVLKFFLSKNCAACEAISAPFKRAAARGVKSNCRFFTVDAMAHMRFCKEQENVLMWN